MSFDTRYRPFTYSDVLGQDHIVKVLKSLVRNKAGFRQSYVFCGAFGSGKTTLARIFARALLCDTPVDGEACGVCPSCQGFQSGQGAETLFEVDAATNSGKGDVKKLLQDLDYASFSGKRKIYIMDESHRLSKEAFDALLKPMEDMINGSEDKRLVCIFCTTEPEKMRPTILSRCAPSFVIRPASVEAISDRLAYVCGQEDIAFEPEALKTITEVSKLHIRDALKTLEGVSQLGDVTVENTSSYLFLGVDSTILQMTKFLKSDLNRALFLLEEVLEKVSPSVLYEKMVGFCSIAFRLSIGVPVKIPDYLPQEDLVDLSTLNSQDLLKMVRAFSTQTKNPSKELLICDFSMIHYGEPDSSKKFFVNPGMVSKKGESVSTNSSMTPNGVYVARTQVSDGTLSPKDFGARLLVGIGRQDE
jgi:DNA polymerase III subunit gamma/tau